MIQANFFNNQNKLIYKIEKTFKSKIKDKESIHFSFFILHLNTK
jgi:hypothetical protein